MTTEPRTRLVEVSGDLFEFIGTRDADGRALSYEWGEPTGHEPDSDRYVYSPTITATDDGWLAEQRAEAFASGRAAALEEIRATIMDELTAMPGDNRGMFYDGAAAAYHWVLSRMSAHPAEAEEKP